MNIIGSFTKKDNATNNMITTATQLDTETLRCLTDTSRRIELIKELRNFSGIGLTEAKEKIDAALDWHNETNTSNIEDRDLRFVAIENVFIQHANVKAEREPIPPTTIAAEQSIVNQIEKDLLSQIAANQASQQSLLLQRERLIAKEEGLNLALQLIREYKQE